MSVLVVGSVALDSVETPFGKAEEVLGGSANMFASAACHFTQVRMVGVIGSDYPVEKLEPLKAKGVDMAGVETAEGESFRWRARYRHDLNSAETLETRLGVFSHFRPKIPTQFLDSPFVFLGNIDPRLQIDVLKQVPRPKLVACDTMNFWIESRRADLLTLVSMVDLITLNDAEARQLTEQANLVKAARWIMERGPSHVVIKKGEHGCLIPRARVIHLPADSLAGWLPPTI
jgi:sugar/nucleoside kinase (ribokinase family)